MSARFVHILALVSALVLATAGAAFAFTVFTVKSENSAALGKIAVNSKGFALYHNTQEKHGKIVCTGACATAWPPLLTTKTAKLKAGPAISASKLGRIKRPDGRFQVTYYGEPLYRYAGDTKQGEVNGEGIGGIWFAVGTNGKLAKPASTGSTTTTTTPYTAPGTTTGTTTTGPYGY